MSKGFDDNGGLNLDETFSKLNKEPAIPSNSKQLSSKIVSPKNIKVTSKKVTSDPEEYLAALLLTKQKKKSKVFVGFHLSEEVDAALNTIKYETGLDKSEAIESAVRIVFKSYFERKG